MAIHKRNESARNYYDKLRVLESADHPTGSLERLSLINEPLLVWYKEHARILPWREEPTPYRVWVSEIMLQQTRVEAVKPYFIRFLEELPDVKALACAGEDRLLKLWEGLGYYNRAKNLQKAARIMMRDFSGQVPEDYDELLKLPGIGSYTAGAIASIAYGKPVPAVDGNVLRVVSRVLASREDVLRSSVKRKFEEDLKETMPRNEAGQFNQSLIEIGAVICVPNGRPRCGECPLSGICLAARDCLWDSIPYRAPKKPRRIEERTVLLIESGDYIAIRKRPDAGLLASMYEFPNLEGRLSASEVRDLFSETDKTCRVIPAGDARHVFSHVEWHMTGYLIKAAEIPKEYLAAERRQIHDKYPLPNAFRAYIELINGES